MSPLIRVDSVFLISMINSSHAGDRMKYSKLGGGALFIMAYHVTKHLLLKWSADLKGYIIT